MTSRDAASMVRAFENAVHRYRDALDIERRADAIPTCEGDVAQSAAVLRKALAARTRDARARVADARYALEIAAAERLRGMDTGAGQASLLGGDE
jgi:hypothetical protein